VTLDKTSGDKTAYMNANALWNVRLYLVLYIIMSSELETLSKGWYTERKVRPSFSIWDTPIGVS